MKTLMVALTCLVLSVSIVCAEGKDESAHKDSVIFVPVVGYKKQVGVSFDRSEVNMVALYQGNNMYLRPFSKTLRILLGKEEAVCTKTIQLPELISKEAVHGTGKPFTLIIADKKENTDFELHFEEKKNLKVINGRFELSRGDTTKTGILFLKKDGSVSIYGFSASERGVRASLHTLTKAQYDAAKKRVVKKLKSAGRKTAAGKMKHIK